ncbi:MAG: DUF3800 domain-containing protein [Deltaproteobacteria bacterium]|nr:DUF3800 domain-containing protein [Deltaproteobacteria bacterium]MBW2089628.1 DUF3800 domain-containing protein [Deltaproteobacteria bacterium]
MNLYLDESGDLGFTFDKPYRYGGSSRHLTIAFLLVPKELSHLPKRIVKKLYQRKKQPTSKELKGPDLIPRDRLFLANKIVNLLDNHPGIEAFAITVYKKNVEDHIRRDANKLYNYMTSLVLLDKIKDKPNITFIPDKRSIKVQSGNSLVDYLQTKLMFEFNSKTIIENEPQESHKVLNLQLVHFITNFIWKKYEDNHYPEYNILKQKVQLTHLFFPRT